jgi:hypothetical protein
VRCDAPLAVADVAADVAGAGSAGGGRSLSAAAIASRPPSSSSCLFCVSVVLIVAAQVTKVLVSYVYGADSYLKLQQR